MDSTGHADIEELELQKTLDRKRYAIHRLLWVDI